MPNLIQRNLIQDSDRHAVMQVIIESDGSSDLIFEPIVDANTDFVKSLPGGSPGAILLGIDQMWYDSSSTFGASFSSMLYFQSAGVDQDHQRIWGLSPSPGDTHHDWRDFGGIKDRLGIDSTGRILWSTQGFVDISCRGSLILAMKKYYRPASDYPQGTLTTAPSISSQTPATPSLSTNISGNRDG